MKANNLPNICLAGVQVPFVYGGAEFLLEILDRELKKRSYRSDIVRIPFKWHPKEMIIKSCLATRMLDLDESYVAKIDILIAFKFPAYVIKHPCKVVWLFHQHREIYDLFNTDFTTFTESDEDHDLRLSLVRIDQKTLSESKKIFTCSNNVKNRLEKYCGIQSEVLYHPPRLVGNFKCKDYEDFLLSVGRLELNKRVDLIIKAFKHVDKDKKLVIVGDGPQKDNLKKLAYELGIQKRIKFVGWVNDFTLVDLYSRCLGVIYPPQDEDYGYVTLEAFSSKKPVVTTSDSGGVLEFVEEGKSGFVASPDPESLSENINRLTKEKSRDLGQEGYIRVKDLSWDLCIEKLTAYK
jgi:glycosyltransferase involved in cell wall biosynthesis